VQPEYIYFGIGSTETAMVPAMAILRILAVGCAPSLQPGVERKFVHSGSCLSAG
jgi:hypothetical protein